jgi:predicted nuclease of restriction endonuclease-like RecB superfamily
MANEIWNSGYYCRLEEGTMLRSDLIRPRLETREGRVWTRSLRPTYHYLTMASELTALFQRHVGDSRGGLAAALRDYEGDSLDYPVIRGLAAVLEARCDFASAELSPGEGDGPLKPAELRVALFQRGPVTGKRDLFTLMTREQALAETAIEYGLQPAQVETALFSDLAEEQILLEAGGPIAPGDLIARYNLELARGLLYWAREVRLRVYDNYKDFFKYIKLFKLMYTARPLAGQAGPQGYHITLHGPLSPFVKSTIRYGIQFAKFMPALLLGQHWQMEADVLPPGGRSSQPLRYLLDDKTELRTHFKASGLFDSRLEADFAAEFEAKYSGPRRKWELAREDELILVGDTVMIPDFSFTHRKDGRRALLEIVGFWHPNYLERKLAKVRQAGRQDLILLVYQSANVAEGEFEAASAGEVLTFTRKPVLKDVLAAVERSAVQPESQG